MSVPCFVRVLLPRFFIVFIVIMVGNNVVFCQKREKIEKLQATVDSLERELENCRQSTAFIFLQLAEREREYPETKFYTVEERREELMEKIRDLDDETYEIGTSIFEKVDSFTLFIDELKNELVIGSGGVDDRGYPINKSDKVVVNKILIEEGKGDLLEYNMRTLRTDFVENLGPDFDVEKLSFGMIEFPEKHSSWAEFKFTNMPVVAVLALLSQIRGNAQTAGLIVLEHISGTE